ncbi:ComF family protein [Parapedobacter tibetensis]|uniref:ComF family protein n=1 Tax=Parapedobacter tibetensis TaxID=2972951 RepID=UPI00214D63FE|nr:ComF family protein [Parapedobacter tibetensis]
MLIKRYLKDLTSLFFPQTCVGCDKPLAYREQIICTDCWYHLPYTHAHKDPHNEGARQLWGRVQLEAVASYLYFLDSSRVQNILHHFKYRNRPEIGTLLGSTYGEILRAVEPFDQVDAIIPVPLHPAKLRKRGYNQSTFFAKGISLSMQKRVLEDSVIRNKASESQTKKNRYERYENLLGTFAVPNPSLIAGKHLLLVDDVLTTGATLEACATALLTSGAQAVSVATIAKAL